MSTIACCLCGVLITPNEAAMCLDCLRLNVDITSDIERTAELSQCSKCERWHVRQDNWTKYDIESPGLLSLCLKKISGLSKAKILDASWIWTEPHSKRLKVAVDLEKSVLDDKMNIRQRVVIEYVIRNKQCMECIREATDHSWGALIQLRQRVGHKRSLYLLEDQLTKVGLHNLMSGIQMEKEGVDLYFKAKNQAERVVEFISSNIPTKTKTSKKLISADHQSNTQKYEYTIFMEVAAVAKGDLVFFPKESGRTLTLMLISKVSSSLHLIGPSNMTQLEITSSKYFMRPFYPVMTTRDLISFIVLDIEPVLPVRSQQPPSKQLQNTEETITDNKNSIKDSGGLLAEAQVVRESDFGVSDEIFRVITHLGHVLKAGDTALGYDLQHAVMDDELISHLSIDPPDVVLVRKTYPERRGGGKKGRRSSSSSNWVKGSEEGGGSGRRAKKSSGSGTGGVAGSQGGEEEVAGDAEYAAFLEEVLEETETETETGSSSYRELPPLPPCVKVSSVPSEEESLTVASHPSNIINKFELDFESENTDMVIYTTTTATTTL